MKKNTAYITILLLAVLVAAVLSIRLFAQKSAPEASAGTQRQQINPPVAETENSVTPPAESLTAGSETAPPAPETAPPAPIEAPVFETRPPIETAEPTPGPASASGSFRSDTGTYLNIVAEWSAVPDGGSATLQVDVYALSYSLHTDALASAVELTVNDETYTADSAAVHYDGSEPTRSPLASFHVDVPVGGVGMSIVWHYRGSYSGVALDDIAAAGAAQIG